MEWEEEKELPHGVPKLLEKYSNYTLLILDEWLIQMPTEPQIHFLFELIERRYDEKSTIFCTQYKLEEWHAKLGGGVLADFFKTLKEYAISGALELQINSVVKGEVQDSSINKMRLFFSK